MSAATQVDYDALAAQHGGSATVDYDSLAAQHGGSAAPAPPAEKPGFFTRLAQSIGMPTSNEQIRAAAPKTAIEYLDALDPVNAGVNAIVNYAKTAGAGIKEGVSDAFQTGKDLRAGDISLKQAAGRAGADAMHSFLQSTPVVGPSIERAGEDVFHGNTAGAAGGLTGVVGQLAAPEIAERGGPALAKAGPAAKNALGAVADSVNPDILGIISPRAAHIIRTLKKVSDALPAGADETTHPVVHASAEKAIKDLSLLESSSAVPGQPVKLDPAKTFMADPRTHEQILQGQENYVGGGQGKVATGVVQGGNEAPTPVNARPGFGTATTPIEERPDMKLFYGKTSGKSNLRANQRQLASPTGSTAPNPSAQGGSDLTQYLKAAKSQLPDGAPESAVQILAKAYQTQDLHAADLLQESLNQLKAKQAK